MDNIAWREMQLRLLKISGFYYYSGLVVPNTAFLLLETVNLDPCSWPNVDPLGIRWPIMKTSDHYDKLNTTDGQRLHITVTVTVTVGGDIRPMILYSLHGNRSLYYRWA